MKAMKILACTILVALFAAGAASAESVDITSKAPQENGAYVFPYGVNIGDDTYQTQAEYTGWNLTKNPKYSIVVCLGTTDEIPCNPSEAVWNFPLTLMSASDFNERITWVPTMSDVGNTYTIWAFGVRKGAIAVRGQETNPTPELSTGVLMSAGLIGLVGLSRYRRKE